MLEDEPVLQYGLLLAIDGNDSPKRLKDKGAGDQREYNSDYFIPLAEVNEWDIHKETRPSLELSPAAEGDWEDVDKENEGDPKDCVKNWKAAQSDSQKKVLGIFDESGWFAAACRHGIVLWVTDMVQSGEQYEHPFYKLYKAAHLLLVDSNTLWQL